MALNLVYPENVFIVYPDKNEVEEINQVILFDQWGEPETEQPPDVNEEER